MGDESESRDPAEITSARQRELLEQLAERFEDPDDCLDWDALRDGKLKAWPLPPEHYEP